MSYLGLCWRIGPYFFARYADVDKPTLQQLQEWIQGSGCTTLRALAARIFGGSGPKNVSAADATRGTPRVGESVTPSGQRVSTMKARQVSGSLK
jgi:hypothetical protein